MTSTPTPQDSAPTSMSLLEGLRLNVAESWGRLTDFYGPLVYQKCRRAGLSDQDSQDVAQNVFMKVFKSFHTFRRSPPEMLFRKWFKTVTRSVVTDFIRKQQKSPDRAVGESSLISWNNLAAALDNEASLSIDDVDLSVAVRRMLELIRPQYDERNWQAFWLTAVEDQSPHEVAERLDLTANNVRQIKFRITRRLSKELAEIIE